MANIMGSLAAGEAEAIRQRVKSTQARMFVDGKWKGGARPFGWTQEKKQGGGVRLILVKSEADIMEPRPRTQSRAHGTVAPAPRDCPQKTRLSCHAVLE